MVSTRLVALAFVLLAGCSSASGPPPSKDGGAPVTSGGGAGGGSAATSVPAALVGTWTAGRGGTTLSYDTITDTSSPSNASGLAFQFAADGTFAKAYRDSNGGSCPTIVLATESGTVAWSESDFQLDSRHGTTQWWSACGGGVASQPLGDADLDRARYTFQLDGGDLILTRTTDNASARFHRSQ